MGGEKNIFGRGTSYISPFVGRGRSNCDYWLDWNGYQCRWYLAPWYDYWNWWSIATLNL